MTAKRHLTYALSALFQLSVVLIFLLFEPSLGRLLAEEAVSGEEHLEEEITAPEDPSSPTNASLTLDKALHIAEKQSSPIKLARKLIERQYGVLTEVRSEFIPKLSAVGAYERVDEGLLPSLGGAQYGSDEDWRTALELRQSLYRGGSDAARLDAETLRKQAAEHALEAVLNDVFLEVREKFFAVLLARAQYEVRKQSLKLLEEELASERQRLSAGTVSEFNVLRAEVAVENSKTPLIRARNAVKLTAEELRRILGVGEDGEDVPHSVQGELDFSPYEISLAEALDIARRERPELKRLRLLVQAAEKGVRVEWGKYLPRIDVTGSYSVTKSPFSTGSGDNLEGWGAGVEASWDIFDGLRTRGRLKQARADLSAARIEQRQMLLDIEVEVRRVHSSLREARELVLASSKVVEQAEESHRLAKNRLDAGVATQLELLDAEVALTEARSNRVLALHEYNVVLARMQRALGRR